MHLFIWPQPCPPPPPPPAGLEPDRVLPTVGLNLAHFEALGTPLLCWDVGGAAGLRSIWSKYYGGGRAGAWGALMLRSARPRGMPCAAPSLLGCCKLFATPDLPAACCPAECHALVFCVDAADRERFEEAKAALDRTLGVRSTLRSDPGLVPAIERIHCKGAATLQRRPPQPCCRRSQPAALCLHNHHTPSPTLPLQEIATCMAPPSWCWPTSTTAKGRPARQRWRKRLGLGACRTHGQAACRCGGRGGGGRMLCVCLVARVCRPGAGKAIRTHACL